MAMKFSASWEKGILALYELHLRPDTVLQVGSSMYLPGRPGNGSSLGRRLKVPQPLLLAQVTAQLTERKGWYWSKSERQCSVPLLRVSCFP